ncbi:hypothetical protein SAMN06269185_2703 [Natronoarchaeum philippinense]|uniref:IclR helix-turn-helix domain-containing protein n=1 Tax=Natronoarchaeum philippinense TaxID=558529 RepID=A0A285P326_NATPI|nr:hypothetical protein [Natronoarchaeum philippinense]SNZ16130.1 hypothetical protein SAMN06269185_2703 [Natronoarchaeum philippinense]
MRVRAALLIVPLLFALLVAPTAAASPGIPGSADGTSQLAGSTAIQSDGTNQTELRQVFRINLTADGDARWTATTRIHGIDTPDERESFNDLAREHEAGHAEAGYSTETFEPFVANASAATGREMSITDVNHSARLANETGYLSFSFTWTNFAQVEGENVVLGDAFQTETGTWLPRLEAGQRLVIAAPPGYAFDSWNFGTSPDGGVDSGTAAWTGPTSFDAGDIEATYVPTGDTGGPDPPGPDPSLGTAPLVGGGLLAVLLGLAVAWYASDLRREDVMAYVDSLADADGSSVAAGDGGEARSQASTDVDDADPTPSPADEAAPESGTTEAGGGRATAESASTAATASGAEQAVTDADDEDADQVDPELLSDEERVERLLQQNGGRMKQASIVTETGWSNAKVSQLLSAMDDDDRVDKLRIGRENLISLPDEDVTDGE